MLEPRLLNLITNIFRLLFLISLFFSVAILIYMGIMYTTKTEEGAKKVHQMMPLFILGLALVFFSLIIPRLIRLFFGS